MALKVKGKVAAYPTLIEAEGDSPSWSHYLSDQDTARSRWQAIKNHYPDLWFDFVLQTIKGRSRRLGSLGTRSTCGRLMEYCAYLNRDEAAMDVGEAIVAGVIELVSPLRLAQPEWVPADD